MSAAPETDAARSQRLAAMHALMLEVDADLKALAALRLRMAQSRKRAQALAAYYQSPEWMRDFEDQAHNDRPYWRMLSEDGLWDQITERDRVLKQILKTVASELAG